VILIAKDLTPTKEEYAEVFARYYSKMHMYAQMENAYFKARRCGCEDQGDVWGHADCCSTCFHYGEGCEKPTCRAVAAILHVDL